MFHDCIFIPKLLFSPLFASQAGSPTSVNAPCSFSRTSVSPSSQDICRYNPPQALYILIYVHLCEQCYESINHPITGEPLSVTNAGFHVTVCNTLSLCNEAL